MVKIDNQFEDNPIRIGQNSADNDILVAEAEQTDLWFHLNNLPSCHVVLKCDKNHPVDKRMINYSASLVKENTKFKSLNKVTVIYTEIRNIKRTSQPGKVIVKGRPNRIIL